MKLRFYIDFWPGPASTSGYFATTQPAAKIQGCKRIAFDVTIPDDMIHEPDGVAPEVSRPQVVPDHD